jgi:hypothetical protein
VLVHAHASGATGLGYTYADVATTKLIETLQHVSPPGPPVIVFHHIPAANSIAVVEYTSASDSHMCSVLTGNPLLTSEMLDKNGVTPPPPPPRPS